MSTTYIDEYLVKLGAAVDASGMQRFHQALREASTVADVSATSIAGAFFKAQTEIVGGFTAIGTAALGLVDKVAMADQQYRLFALHMYMSKDAARSLKVAMDALGEPLENLTWDKELRDRTHQLILDQRAMAPDGDFEGQMRKVRDIRFEFTRMEVEGQYLAMHVVQDFMKALGFGPDELLGKLRQFNDWVTHNLPQIASKITTLFMPVWNDLKGVFLSLGGALMETGVAFTNIVGLITGDHSIEGATFNFEKFVGAITHVVHGFAVFAEAIANVEELLAHLVSALALVASGQFSAAGDELGKAFAGITAKAVGGVVGGVAGGALGSLAGPIGTVGGSVGGAALGSNVFDRVFGSGAAPQGDTGTQSSTIAQQAAALAQSVSRATGIRPDLLWSQWAHETGNFTHLGAANNIAGIRIPGSKQYQSFGSLDDFGKRYAEVVNNSHRYAGLSGAENPEQFAAILKAGGYYEGPEKDYANNMRRYDNAYNKQYGGGSASVANTTHVGTIVVNVAKNNATNEDVGKAVAAQLRDTQNKKVQRNLSEFQDLSWGY